MAASAAAIRADLMGQAQARLAQIVDNKKRYDADMIPFAADCLMIRPKEGGGALFRLNKIQRELHARLNMQRAQDGWVRALILKARQPGISTYVEGRFYWKVSRNPGLRAFILTHRDDATENIFEMTERFHEFNPEAPHTGASNAKELYFDLIDSGFTVGTAGSAGIGRGQTPQFFHGSEVAFWANAEDHFSGAMEAVPDLPGTEVILESTANGIGGLFYNMCEAAERGDGEYQLIFFPWFAHDEYETEPPPGWEPPPAFMDYQALYSLAPKKIYWAWRKNAGQATANGLSTDEFCWKFRQEYPATAKDAFRAAREGSFISGESVARARTFKAGDQSHAALVLGCDFATGGDNEGGDHNYFIDRQGRAAGRKLNDRFKDGNTVSVANRLARHIDNLKPAMCFLDSGGGGAGVYDILVNRGYGKVLTLIDFGSRAHDNRKYANKRAEMWGDLRDWLVHPGGAEIPDDNALDGDLTAPKGKEDAHQRVLLEKKSDIRKLFNFSPDGGDALALTKAETVRVAAPPGSTVPPAADDRIGY